MRRVIHDTALLTAVLVAISFPVANFGLQLLKAALPGFSSPAYETQLRINAILGEYLERNNGVQKIVSWSVFSRMTYFSKVAVTTLGYGDITPISNKAKWLVTLESMLGVIVVGLF